MDCFFHFASMKVPEILTLFSSLCLSLHVIFVGRWQHTSVVLSDGSVLVMGGVDPVSGYKNDVWKTVNGGASWILVTSSAAWTGREILHLSNSLPLLPSCLKMLLVDSTGSVCLLILFQST